MRTMYDAVTARNIPATAAMVAGYIDKIKLEPWSAADWARFSNAVKVEIVKKASTNDGHVLDVEPGDARPDEAPGWVTRRRAAGADPTIYVQKSTWAQVQSEFRRQGVAQPHYWIAHYNGVIELPTLNGITAVAKQYRGDVPPGIDLNCVADYWPGVDGTPAPGPAPSIYGEEDQMERKNCTAIGNGGFVSFDLAGTDKASVTIYPGKAKGPTDTEPTAKPVWVGNMYAWGEGHIPGRNDTGGLGGNPSPGPDAIRVDGITTFTFPKARLVEIEFSSNADFYITGQG